MKVCGQIFAKWKLLKWFKAAKASEIRGEMLERTARSGDFEGPKAVARSQWREKFSIMTACKEGRIR